jgi:hypothetical protein
MRTYMQSTTRFHQLDSQLSIDRPTNSTRRWKSAYIPNLTTNIQIYMSSISLYSRITEPNLYSTVSQIFF